MISLRNINISYNLKSHVIKNLNLDLKPSLIHGIVGLNGAGKTTLLNTVFGLIKAQSGEIVINNEKLTKRHIAYLPTENYFYPKITGREYLSLFENNDFNVDEWNKLFLLPLDKLIDGYSTGMKKKLALIGTLKKDKPVIILDEPFNGLDIETSRITRNILLQLKEKGKTIIVTSHIIETLTNLCDYIHYLNQGEIQHSLDKTGFEKFEKEIFKTIEAKSNEIIQGLLS